MKIFFKILNIFLLALILFLVGFLVGKKYDFAFDENDDIVGLQYSSNEQKIRRLVSLIDNQYVNDVNSDNLVDEAINFMIGKLDPHSTYLNKDMIKKANEELSGEYAGVGLQYRVINDTAVVSQMLPGSPNYEKLKFGDRIIEIANKPVFAENLKQFTALLKGKNQSSVDIKIIRNKQPLSIKLKRSMVPVPTVTGKHMINEEIGYIKLTRFGDKSAIEVHSALKELLDQGMKTLVFDLRGNPGGVMRVAEEIADEFLTKDELIVYTQDKSKAKKYIYATNYGLFEHGKVYVLIDESSASSSEIVAGALQDYGRGTIVGRRSYGKGLVQREINLGDDTRVRLTVANYFTPSGRSIQRPYDKGKQAYGDDIYQRLKNGELYNKDSIKVNEELRFKAPSGKIVYGGGGIIPDEFVPLDVSSVSNWLVYNNDAKLYQEFIFKKADQFHSLFLLENEKRYINYFGAGILRNDFLNMIGVPSKEFNPALSNTIDTYIKAILANELFGNRAYLEIWSKEDEMIKKILELENTKS
ncbi:S41 family peptidase [Faecalibacter rhinopitheci]|uniref:S41 family peptidase n=1 Tax=Faecalibacter rhinopitheci TaxID=2779678 RepID=A0A8J7KHU9_9FLAO|nr:S41 family peptidase [Faecalibacter rhinopitheci]MBF0596721.1 S41 family peptidase [Faecalibacter rhinopitheci]